MIKVHCHTNLDNCKYGWPTELPALPRVGDKIVSENKSPNGYIIELDVVAVRFVPQKNYATDYGNEHKIVWFPEIELNITRISIVDFYKRHGWMI